MKTEKPLADKTRLSLLNKLRSKALSLNADALILIDKEINTAKSHGMGTANVSNYTVSYKAELISQCKENNRKKQKIAPYNHNGYKVLNINTLTTTIETTFTFTPPIKEKLNHPIITSKEISLKNGLYGVKLGSTHQQVIAAFGDPSLVLSLFKGEVVIGYGRNHWLHFQNNKLVKVQSKLSVISPTLLNMVPLRDFSTSKPGLWLIR